MQPRPAMATHKTGCMYRNESGEKCVVGMFIPDDQYRSSMECGDVKDLLSSFYKLKDFMPLRVSALKDLQVIHDTTNLDVDPRPKLIAWVEEHVE